MIRKLGKRKKKENGLIRKTNKLLADRKSISTEHTVSSTVFDFRMKLEESGIVYRKITKVFFQSNNCTKKPCGGHLNNVSESKGVAQYLTNPHHPFA